MCWHVCGIFDVFRAYGPQGSSTAADQSLARAHNRTAGPVLLAARTFVLSRTTPVAYTVNSAIEKRDPLNDQIEGMLAVAGSGLGGLGREPYLVTGARRHTIPLLAGSSYISEECPCYAVFWVVAPILMSEIRTSRSVKE